jgi:hypothetical protein
MKKLLWDGLAVMALACAACGNSANLYPVSGTVTYQGKPAAGATVFFQRQGVDLMNEDVIMGIVEADGSFTLVSGALGKGAPPGDYDVLIEWKRDLNQIKGLAQKRPDRLKGRYADSKAPRLHAVIKAEGNHLLPFELTDQERLTQPGQRGAKQGR